ncbi:MAG: DUF4102 domain-containing protein [Sediminimonas qiaohouensis]|uniref:DUF4102 domain-containing protein n=1 Tax=Sediminimonas qiaohouensis TaxID=552061 RepID=A0A7C9HAZ9_9RHOB|nr:site-specific integrase [Sediminimonas qiaohouensis]MTJ04530.1 DUF4102 domain-containing protein [Sediminimonas qiaohouensis]
MKKELTDRFLRSLNAPDTGRIEHSDTKRPGLRFRLSSSGRATWVFEKRVKGGAKRKHNLGSWPAVTLSEARKLALEIEAEVSQGIDRIALAEAQRLADEQSAAARISVREVLEKYATLQLSQLKSGSERGRQLQQSLDAWLDLPTGELQQRHLQKIVDAHTQRGKLTMANRVRSALRAFTKWAYQREYLDRDIGVNLSKPHKEKPRERVLSLEEIRAIYRATEELSGLWKPLFRLLILTGQRRSEIVELLWEEVDLNTTRIVKPGSKTKNGKSHITHLSNKALKEIAEISGERSGWVFTTNGDTPVSGISKAKARLDSLLGEGFEPWTIHDLRTAMATTLAEDGVSETVVDKLLNHSAVGSAPSAVARVYQQSDLLSQRARALEKWAALVTNDTAQIVNLHGDVA